MPPPKHSATERPTGDSEAAVRQVGRPVRLPSAARARFFSVVQAFCRAALATPPHTKLVLS
eukprot:2644153-Pyramimonas_sp.AAC.1